MSTALSYITLQNELKGYSAEECHGLLTALLCVNPHSANQLFLNEILQFTEQDPNQNILLELSVQTQAQLESNDFDFQPLLPDENSALKIRSAAIARWCQGFIYGIGISRPKMDEDITEFIADLTEFTHLDEQDSLDEADEENEIALEELIEFIRMGTLLTHQNFMQNQPISSITPSKNTMH